MDIQGHVDDVLPPHRLAVLGFQHVLVMYAGAIAVPLIVGRALQLPPADVAFLISADLFCCGLATVIQSLGVTQWFGIRLPVMMGVSFAAVSPILVMAGDVPGENGARLIFGSVIGAGIFALLIAPFFSRLLRFFPPVVTGTIILVIGVSLMRIGINWIFTNPGGPNTPLILDPGHVRWLDSVRHVAGVSGSGIPDIPGNLTIAPSLPNPAYGSLGSMGISLFVLALILAIAKYSTGFMKNIAVLIGMIGGGLVAVLSGDMVFDGVSSAGWFRLIEPFHYGIPVFDPLLILMMCLAMIVVMIESSGMFLALGEMTGRKIDQRRMTAGLRADGLGALIGGVFNTFPYTSFSQNIGLVGVTGVRSRFVCVAGGLILIGLGLVPKLSALVDALPTAVLGGAGIVMFGMVAATGIRILAAVDFNQNRNNLFIVAISLGLGMVPLIAPEFKQWLPHQIQSLADSGILLASASAVLLNLYFNGAGTAANAVAEAKQSAFAAGEHG